MNYGQIQLTSHRTWLVPDFVVWGLPGLGDIDYLNIESVAGTKSLFFGAVTIGDTAQSISFASLIDIRGNNLPDTISRALVTVRSHSAEQVFVVGLETSTGFKIARDPAAAGPVKVDLIITELGE